MAKLQRSVQLPAHLYRLAESFEAQSGAKFNRQALAAFLQFFFSHARPPNTAWMLAAVSVEKGELSLGMVGLEMAKRRVQSAVSRARAMKETVDAGRANPLAMDECYRRIQEEQTAMREWEDALELADDPLEALAAYWSEWASQHTIVHVGGPDDQEDVGLLLKLETAEEAKQRPAAPGRKTDPKPSPKKK